MSTTRRSGWPVSGGLYGGSDRDPKSLPRAKRLLLLGQAKQAAKKSDDQVGKSASATVSSDPTTSKAVAKIVDQPPAKSFPVPVADVDAVQQVPPQAHGGPTVQQVPPKDCPKCLHACHSCKQCGKIRCKQHHLSTQDDGESFLCSQCDPTIVGLSGPLLVPGGGGHGDGQAEDVLQGEGQPPKKMKINLDLLAKELNQQMKHTLDSPSKRSSVITATPKKNRIQVANQNTPTVHDQQHGGDDVHAGGDDVQAAVPVVFTAGSIKNVFFMGLYGQTAWDRTLLKSYFFLVVPPGDRPVQLRTSCDCTVAEVIQAFLIPTYNLAMINPILTFQGQVVEPNHLLSQYENKALFLLVDGQFGHVPELPIAHQGKVWQCLDCGMATNDKCKFAQDSKKFPGKCPSNHSNIMFPGIFQATWGRNLDRWPSPWGCPPGHGGVEPLVTIQEVPQFPHHEPGNVPLVHPVAALQPIIR
jgi:hypothetical protein